MGTPRRIKGIDDKITCKSAQKLNNTDADNALAVKFLQGLWKLISRLGCCQHLSENVRVLNRLTSSLQCRIHVWKIKVSKPRRSNEKFKMRKLHLIEGLTWPKLGIIGWTASPISTTFPSAQDRSNSGGRSYKSLCSTESGGVAFRTVITSSDQPSCKDLM